jgi:hypothetical protein
MLAPQGGTRPLGVISLALAAVVVVAVSLGVLAPGGIRGLLHLPTRMTFRGEVLTV